MQKMRLLTHNSCKASYTNCFLVVTLAKKISEKNPIQINQLWAFIRNTVYIYSDVFLFFAFESKLLNYANRSRNWTFQSITMVAYKKERTLTN